MSVCANVKGYARRHEWVADLFSLLAVALLFVLFSAPDLAMTQMVAEALTVILLVLVFYHLPRVVPRSRWGARLRDLGLAIAVGALIDGIPESIAIGLSILHGGAVSIATVAAIFLSNLPEGLSSSAGMRKAGRSAAYVFGVWTVIAVACGLASLAGYVVFDGFSPFIVAATTAVAAGGMLAMIVDTMIPEAVAETHDWARRFVVLGFLVSFTLTKIAG